MVRGLQWGGPPRLETTTQVAGLNLGYNSLMSKRTPTFDPRQAARRMAWAEHLADERDRRRPNRAVTLPNAKHKANKAACRKGSY